MKKTFSIIAVVMVLFGGLWYKTSTSIVNAGGQPEVKYARVYEYANSDDKVGSFINTLTDGQVFTYTIRLQVPDEAEDIKIMLPSSFAYQTFIASQNLSEKGEYKLKFSISDTLYIQDFLIQDEGLVIDGLFSYADYYESFTVQFDVGTVSINDVNDSQSSYIGIDSGYVIDKTGVYSIRTVDEHGNVEYYHNVKFHLDSEVIPDNNSLLVSIATAGLIAVIGISLFQIIIVARKNK